MSVGAQAAPGLSVPLSHGSMSPHRAREERAKKQRKEFHMRKFIALVSSAFAVAALAFAPAAMAGPHYVTGPTATVSGNSLTVSWKAAGLGNTVESVDFALTGSATVTSQCFTR